MFKSIFFFIPYKKNFNAHISHKKLQHTLNTKEKLQCIPRNNKEKLQHTQNNEEKTSIHTPNNKKLQRTLDTKENFQLTLSTTKKTSTCSFTPIPLKRTSYSECHDGRRDYHIDDDEEESDVGESGEEKAQDDEDDAEEQR